jgi:hypothetical protein
LFNGKLCSDFDVVRETIELRALCGRHEIEVVYAE